MNEWLYIFDFSVCSINQIHLTKEDRKMKVEDILDKYGFHIEDCQWMFSDSELVINEIN